MSKKAAFHNLGCKVNSYETEAMRRQLLEGGYEIVPEGEQADVYIINTCTVTNIADQKSRQMLHRAKKQNPDAVVVAAGCYVQARGDEVLADPAVDIIIGNNQKGQLLSLLEEYFAGKEEKRAVLADLTGPSCYEELDTGGAESHTRAFFEGAGRLQSILQLLHHSLCSRTGAQQAAGGCVQRGAASGTGRLPGGGAHRHSFKLLWTGI